MAYPISNSISKSTVNTFFKSLTGKTGHTQGAFLDMDYEIKYDGKKYVLKKKLDDILGSGFHKEEKQTRKLIYKKLKGNLVIQGSVLYA